MFRYLLVAPLPAQLDRGPGRVRRRPRRSVTETPANRRRRPPPGGEAAPPSNPDGESNGDGPGGLLWMTCPRQRAVGATDETRDQLSI
eukprot:149708-Pyramimonas_sp.AAC.1